MQKTVKSRDIDLLAGDDFRKSNLPSQAKTLERAHLKRRDINFLVLAQLKGECVIALRAGNKKPAIKFLKF